MRRAVKHRVNARTNPAVGVSFAEQLVYQACDVLSGGNARDRSREDVVEHQRGDAQLGQRSTQGFLHHAIHAAAHEHRAALDVHCAHSEREQHYAEDEPWSRSSKGVFSYAADIVSGRAEIVENDRRRAPERNEREGHRGGDHDSYSIGGR